MITDPQSRIYDCGAIMKAQDRATQIRHLALIGLAGSDSVYPIKDIKAAYVSLFEVIARLADEIEDTFDQSEGAAA